MWYLYLIWNFWIHVLYFVSTGENDQCNLPKKIGPCKARKPRFYYDQKTGSCRRFFWGGCQANGNNFKTEEMCKGVCGNIFSLDCLRVPLNHATICIMWLYKIQPFTISIVWLVLEVPCVMWLAIVGFQLGKIIWDELREFKRSFIIEHMLYFSNVGGHVNIV